MSDDSVLRGPAHTYGPRFGGGGYQFPRTHSASLQRGEPIRREEIPGVGSVSIVPLTGGQRKQFDICAQYREDGVDVSHTYVAHDELEAREQFARLVRKLKP